MEIGLFKLKENELDILSATLSGSGTVTIPIALAKALNWNHQDEIRIIIDVKMNQKGLFLFKKE